MPRPLLISAALLLLFPLQIISEPLKKEHIPLLDTPLEIVLGENYSLLYNDLIFLKLKNNDIENLSSPCRHAKTILNTVDTGVIVAWRLLGSCAVPLIQYHGKNYVVPIAGYHPRLEGLSDISTSTLENTLEASQKYLGDKEIMTQYQQSFYADIRAVLNARNSRFSLPILDAKLPQNASHLPNAPRPYRSEVTDGVHHGWDFYVTEGTTVHAIEDGVIVRLKTDFSWDEMNHLHDGKSDLELQENLEVFRGNTVYLKTLTGNVAIYAHLSEVPSHITVGSIVKRGDVLGKVGDSAVPSKKYLYHLHFELAMNPYNDLSAGKNTYSNILLWPFWGQGKTTSWVDQNDDTIFEK